MINKEQLRLNMIQTPELYKTKNGANLVSFYRKLVCSDTTRNPCTEKQLMESESVKFEGIELTKSNSYLTAFRTELMDTLKTEIESYFPEGSFSDFELLDPKKFLKRRLK